MTAIADAGWNQCPQCQGWVPGPKETCPGCRPAYRSILDLVLRGPEQLDAMMRDERNLPALIQRLLFLSLAGLLVHGLVVGASAQLLEGSGLFAQGHPAVWMPLCSMLAFVGALCLCLPSFYFYTQLSGLDASFRLVTAQALRGQATTSLFLFSALPFYGAWVLAGMLGAGQVNGMLVAGVTLPFLVGLLGVRAVYRAFKAMAATMPITHRRRGNFLGRLVLCWSAVYTAVAPVALWRLCEALSGVL